MRYLLVIVVSVLVWGCQSTPQIRELAPSSQNPPMELAETTSFQVGGGVRSSYSVALEPGVYVPRHESAEGVFYLGPNKAIRVQRGGNPPLTMLARGGLFLPNSSTEPSRVWFYSGSVERYINGQLSVREIDRLAQSMSSDIAIEWQVPQEALQEFQR